MYINVNDYKHLECDSDMIQQAVIDAAKLGKSVLIPKFNERTGQALWNITKTILLEDESDIVLQNAYLRLGDGAYCNAFANKNARIEGKINECDKQRNITIRGIGSATLDGGIHNGMYENNGISRKVAQKYDHHISENCMMYFRNMENLKIDNLFIKNQRYWGICMYTTSYSRISNIRYSSISNVPNQDGVDICKGCHDIIVENIFGCVGDNLVALLTTEDSIYSKVVNNVSEGDIRNITIRNIMGYGVGGCALIRLLNHDGYKIYNIRIDNVIEISPWSENDASVAQNPDLVITTDENGDIVPWRQLIPGEEGYRTEAAIIIGESYWYAKEKAKHGETFGISVSNVMTHSRYALFINNTLIDSTFDNIRLFGNGFMAAYFGEGEVENLRFSNVTYDEAAKPLKDDEHIYIDWNNTRSDGFSCVYANGMKLTNVVFENMQCGKHFDSVLGGHGSGEVIFKNINTNGIKEFSVAEGIDAKR